MPKYNLATISDKNKLTTLTHSNEPLSKLKVTRHAMFGIMTLTLG